MLGKYHDINFLSTLASPSPVSQSFTVPIFLLQLFFGKNTASGGKGEETTSRDYGAH
jgi:hypothetical protein